VGERNRVMRCRWIGFSQQISCVHHSADVKHEGRKQLSLPLALAPATTVFPHWDTTLCSSLTATWFPPVSGKLPVRNRPCQAGRRTNRLPVVKADRTASYGRMDGPPGPVMAPLLWLRRRKQPMSPRADPPINQMVIG
jgi:hypothetical protein